MVTRARPDLTWSYSVAATMMTRNPKEAAARVRHMLGYVKKTVEVGLCFDIVHEDPKVIDVYGDASFAPTGGASHGGSIAFVYGNAISWRSHRQTVVAASTAEAELIEATEAQLHTRPIVLLLAELEQEVRSSFLACDNSAALTMVGKAATYPWRSRHISIRGHLLDEAVKSGEVSFGFIGTKEQKADGLTKGLTQVLHDASMRQWKLGATP